MNSLRRALLFLALALVVLVVNSQLRLVGTADLLAAGVIVVGLVVARQRIGAANADRASSRVA